MKMAGLQKQELEVKVRSVQLQELLFGAAEKKEEEEEVQSQVSITEDIVVAKTHLLQNKSGWLQLLEMGLVTEFTFYVLWRKELSSYASTIKVAMNL
jgi:hypothetical protein